MTNFFEKISAFISNLSLDQIVALGLAAVAFILARKILHDVFSVVFMVVAAMGVLYFLFPDLYYQVYASAVGTLSSLWNTVVGFFAKAQ